MFTSGVLIEVTTRYDVKYRSLGQSDRKTDLFWFTFWYEKHYTETNNLHDDFFFHVSFVLSLHALQPIWMKTKNYFVLRTSYKGQVLTYLCPVSILACDGAHWDRRIDVSWASLYRNPRCNVRNKNRSPFQWKGEFNFYLIFVDIKTFFFKSLFLKVLFNL